MVYIAVDTNTKEGKALTSYLEKLAIVQVYKEPNARTLKSMKTAKEGKVREIKDVKSWFNSLIS